MKSFLKLFAISGLFIINACSQNEPLSDTSPDYTITYDVHISGGSIIDGSGNPAVMGDILVSGDKIAFVGTVDRQKIK